jgi:excisionase family DNA binding protein
MTDPVELLTVSEFVAQHKDRLSVDLVCDMVKRGELPAVRAGSKKILIPRDALWRMFEEQDARRKERMGA